MNRKTLSLLFIFVTLSARAEIKIPIVSNYELSNERSIWHLVAEDDVPEVNKMEVIIPRPTHSYSSQFPNSFFQTEQFVVCANECQFDNFEIKDGDIIYAKDGNDIDLLEQSNIYFWTDTFFRYAKENFSFHPSHFLKIFASRYYPLEDNRREQWTMNASYQNHSHSINYLPTLVSTENRTIKGAPNRAGLDPSVILHETAHFYFTHLFPNPINTEMKGLNEAFADYICLSILNATKQGSILARNGKFIREVLPDTTEMIKKNQIYKLSDDPYSYAKLITSLLFQTKNKFENKKVFDQLLVKVVSELGKNPFSTILDLKKKILSGVRGQIPENDFQTINENWETMIPGVQEHLSSEEIQMMKKENMTGLPFEYLLIQYSGSTPLLREPDLELTTQVNLLGNISFQDKAIEALNIHYKDKQYWLLLSLKTRNFLALYDLNGKQIDDLNLLSEMNQLFSNLKYPEKIRQITIAHIQKMIKTTELKTTDGQGAIVNRVADTQAEIVLNNKKEIIKTANFEFTVDPHGTQTPSVEHIQLYLVSPNNQLNDFPDFKGYKIIGYKLKSAGSYQEKRLVTGF